MALEYDLYLGEGLESARLLTVLSSLPGFKVSGRGFAGPGVTGLVFEAAQSRASLIKEEFGIDVRFCAGFRVDLSKHDEKEGYDGMKTIISASLRVLEQGSFDAILLFNGESPVLLRRSGKTLLNKKQGFWRPSMLSMVKVPHELEDLPSL